MEDDFSVEKPRIARLSGPNYRPWSIQVQRLLLSKGLWEVVKLGIDKPKEGSMEEPSGDRTEFKDAKASTIIMGLCTQNTLQHILLLETAKEQWETLKGLYSPLGLQQLSAKIRAFTTYKPPESGASIAEISTQLSTLQYEIGTIDPNERPSNTLKISILFQAIRALDARYSPLILQLEISDTAKDYDTIVAHLTEFERRLGPKEPIKESVLSAKDLKKTPKNTKFKGKCWNCDRIGHRSTECKSPKKPEKSPSTGPLATPNGGRGLSPPPNQPRQQANVATEVSWLAGIKEPKNRDRLLWIIDSGCSRHMTYAREAFTEYRVLDTPIQVTTASGTHIQAIAEGTITTQVAIRGSVRTIELTGVLHVPRLAGSLISVLQLQNKGITIRTTTGAEGNKLVIELQGVMVGEAYRLGKTYALKSAIEDSLEPEVTLQASHPVTQPNYPGVTEASYPTAQDGYPTEGTEHGNYPRVTHDSYPVASGIQNDYPIAIHDGYPMAIETSLETITEDSSKTWHRRLGHLSSHSLQHIHTVTIGLSKPIVGLREPCEACILTKTVKIVNRVAPERANTPLQRIHSDFWGPYSVPTLLGDTYILTFTDDYTRKSWVYFTKARSNLRTLFTEFKTLVELESGYKIKAVRCDNASEYKALGDLFLRDYGIQFEYTTPYTPEQNGVAERLNRSLITMARSMLLDAKLPIRFWGDAVATACYLRNRTPIGPEGKTPEEAYSGKKPYIGHLRAYGCIAYAYVPKEKRTKFDNTEVRTCLIGYMPTSRQYRLYYPENNQIIVSTAPKFIEGKRLEWDWNKDIRGDETTTPFNPMEPDLASEAPIDIGEEEPEARQLGGQEPETSGDIQPETIGDEEPEEPEIRRSGRARRAPIRYEGSLQALSATTITIPKTYEEAINDPIYGASWEQAISEELTKLQALDTWKYSELPPNKKAIGCRWVFTIKYTPTGLIDQFKARLVAQGFSQVPGDDYLETFSPTIRGESLRILLALGASEDLEIRQIDVVSAYPRSKLHALVYMKPPKALNCPKNMVLLLNRSLYGLKQSGREWYIEACIGLEKLGFTPCYSEPSVFINKALGQIIGLYVDDMIILGKELQAIQTTIQGIKSLWEIKDLGDVSRILGLQIHRDRQKRTLTIDQSAYIQEVIERFKLGDAKPISLPVSDRNTLISGSKDDPQADQALYQQAIGCLMWIMKATRFDIAYAISRLSQHCNEPKIRHWNAVLRVLRYLKGTIDYKLSYGNKGAISPKLQGYSDADYAGDIVDRHSISGYLYTLNGGIISWNSTKQRCVSTSTTESEYIALSEASKQGQWIRGLLRELGRTQYLSNTLSVPIFSDNQACIALAKDPISHSRTKHIDIRYHYIRELVAYGKTTIDYKSTEEMVADLLTKPLPLIAYKRCIQGLLSL